MMGGGLGTKWDRWEVVGRGFGKMENGGIGCRGGRKWKFSKMSGSIFPALGDQKYAFLAYSRTSEKIKKNAGRRHGGALKPGLAMERKAH